MIYDFTLSIDHMWWSVYHGFRKIPNSILPYDVPNLEYNIVQVLHKTIHVL